VAYFTVVESDSSKLVIKVSEVQGCRGRGRPNQTWEQSVKCDIRKYGMQRVKQFDKDKWRSCCGSNRPTRAIMEKKDVINCFDYWFD